MYVELRLVRDDKAGTWTLIQGDLVVQEARIGQEWPLLVWLKEYFRGE